MKKDKVNRTSIHNINISKKTSMIAYQYFHLNIYTKRILSIALLVDFNIEFIRLLLILEFKIKIFVGFPSISFPSIVYFLYGGILLILVSKLLAGWNRHV